MLAPDEIPWYFALPAAIVLWGTWIGIRIAEVREKHRRIRLELEWEQAPNHTNGSDR